jgi:hypothetical protein
MKQAAQAFRAIAANKWGQPKHQQVQHQQASTGATASTGAMHF